MGGGALVLCSLLVVGVTMVTGKGSTPPTTIPASSTAPASQQNVTHALEPHGTGYHPVRLHQRPTDTSQLQYFSGSLDEDEDVTLDNRRNPAYYNPPTQRPPMGPGGQYQGQVLVQGQGQANRRPLKTVFGWTEIDYTWPSPQARRDAINSGAYQSHQIIPLDMDVFEFNGRRKVFVTMPRGDGVPAALATVSTEGRKKSPKLAPYPDWSWHGNGTCDGISSVYRIMGDECGRLWVLDRGDGKQCTPQLLLFDMRTDALLSRYRFPPHLLKNGSNLITVSVDIRHNKCGEAFAYIADVVNPAIIVFDARREDAWRVEHPSMRPILEYATYRIAGREFYLTDGVFGLALGPLHRGDRMLYYHPLASVYESWVPTSVLRRKENFPNRQNLASNQFHTSRGQRASQSAAQAMDNDGNLFSSLLSQTALTCWNSQLEFGGWNLPVIFADPELLQFPSGMKIRDGNIWIFTSRYQNFATDTMDWNDINYRILTGRLEDLTRGTMCDSRSASAINSLG